MSAKYKVVPVKRKSYVAYEIHEKTWWGWDDICRSGSDFEDAQEMIRKILSVKKFVLEEPRYYDENAEIIAYKEMRPWYLFWLLCAVTGLWIGL